jgi:hypothetical protein
MGGKLHDADACWHLVIEPLAFFLFSSLRLLLLLLPSPAASISLAYLHKLPLLLLLLLLAGCVRASRTMPEGHSFLLPLLLYLNCSPSI